MISTTLNAIRACRPCEGRWQRLLRRLGKTQADDEPLPLLTILESNGANDTLWCMRALGPEHDAWVRLVVCDLVEPAMKYAGDPRPAEALTVARRFARGEAALAELNTARAAAWAAWNDAWEAVMASPRTKTNTTGAAARAAAGATAREVWEAAWAAVWAAAWGGDVQAEQERILRRHLA